MLQLFSLQCPLLLSLTIIPTEQNPSNSTSAATASGSLPNYVPPLCHGNSFISCLSLYTVNSLRVERSPLSLSLSLSLYLSIYLSKAPTSLSPALRYPGQINEKLASARSMVKSADSSTLPRETLNWISSVSCSKHCSSLVPVSHHCWNFPKANLEAQRLLKQTWEVATLKNSCSPER